MLITDPIGDMLIRIKNALLVKHDQVSLPHSKIKEAIAQLLKDNQYIEDYQVEARDNQDEIVIKLRYVEDLPAITGVKRMSKPGRRYYVAAAKIPSVLGGYGITIVSTNKGLLTDQEARKQNVGGEVLCQVW